MNTLLCGPDNTTTIGPCDDQLLGDAHWHHFDRPQIAVCVTLYNEGLACLQATLQSLALALREKAWGERAPDKSLAVPGPGAARPDCICIIADGITQLSPEVLAYLQQQGWIGELAPSPMDAHLTRCFHSLQPPAAEAGDTASAAMAGLRIIVCLKHSNQGKLHSHALFLARLCERMKPEICCQIDTGTTVDRQAMLALSRHFRQQPDAGALAARVSCGVPAEGDGLLARWQAMDFAVQLATHWPAELISGHLSVIPGQFCAFRWEALAGADRRPAASAASAETPAASVIARYLRGLVPANALERIMYLAEDRVIGNELALAPGRPWRLDYGLDVVATTDACTSLPELQRQRRRWNNCSFACRLWLLGQWPALLARADRSIWFKLRLSGALLWQLMLALLQAATPAAVICTLAAIAQAFLDAWMQPGAWLPPLALAALVLSTPLILWTPRAGRLRAHAALRDGMTLAAMVLLITSVSQVLPAAAVLLLWLPVSAGAALAALPACGATTPPLQVLRRVPEFMAVNGLVQLLLWRYALAHLHDTSWGTKGLVGTAAAAADKPMRRLARSIAAGWLLLNAGLIGLGFAKPGLLLPALNPVAEAVCSLAALGCAMALVHLAMRQATALWRRLPRKRPRRQGADASLPALSRD